MLSSRYTNLLSTNREQGVERRKFLQCAHKFKDRKLRNCGVVAFAVTKGSMEGIEKTVTVNSPPSRTHNMYEFHTICKNFPMSMTTESIGMFHGVGTWPHWPWVLNCTHQLRLNSEAHEWFNSNCTKNTECCSKKTWAVIYSNAMSFCSSI